VRALRLRATAYKTRSPPHPQTQPTTAAVKRAETALRCPRSSSRGKRRRPREGRPWRRGTRRCGARRRRWRRWTRTRTTWWSSARRSPSSAASPRPRATRSRSRPTPSPSRYAAGTPGRSPRAIAYLRAAGYSSLRYQFIRNRGINGRLGYPARFHRSRCSFVASRFFIILEVFFNMQAVYLLYMF